MIYFRSRYIGTCLFLSVPFFINILKPKLRQARVVTESVIDNDNRSQDNTEIKEEPVESS